MNALGRLVEPARHTAVPSAALQRKCACGQHTGGGECEGCKKKNQSSPAGYGTLQRRAVNTAPASPVPPVVHEVLRSPGQPLDTATRSFFEPRFRDSLQVGRPHSVFPTGGSPDLQIEAADGFYEREAESIANRITSGQRGSAQDRSVLSGKSYDFSRVRVHTGTRAEESARTVNALAYTVGNDIVFGAGQFNPVGEAGRRLLAHELVHVAQQQAGSAGLVQRQGGPAPVDLPEPEECENRTDITKEFKDFLKNLPAVLQSAPDFTPEQRVAFQGEIDRFLGTNAGVNVGTYKIISCDAIHSDLLLPGESAEAEVDPNKKEIRMSKRTKQFMDEFLKNKDKQSLTQLIQTLAHEKRHVTLGAALKVDPKAVLPGRPETVAGKAEYRAQEILAVAEELAVARMAIGDTYAAPTSKQEKLRIQNNMIRNYVTEAEYQRLRSIIIAKLRERYGFRNHCDTSLTLGIVTSMQRGEWFVCDYSGPGRITSPVPADLNICSNFCKPPKDDSRPRTTENEEGTDTPKSNVILVP